MLYWYNKKVCQQELWSANLVGMESGTTLSGMRLRSGKGIAAGQYGAPLIEAMAKQ